MPDSFSLNKSLGLRVFTVVPPWHPQLNSHARLQSSFRQIANGLLETKALNRKKIFSNSCRQKFWQVPTTLTTGVLGAVGVIGGVGLLLDLRFNYKASD